MIRYYSIANGFCWYARYILLERCHIAASCPTLLLPPHPFYKELSFFASTGNQDSSRGVLLVSLPIRENEFWTKLETYVHRGYAIWH
jgi:hypothetical protein